MNLAVMVPTPTAQLLVFWLSVHLPHFCHFADEIINDRELQPFVHSQTKFLSKEVNSQKRGLSPHVLYLFLMLFCEGSYNFNFLSYT